MENNTLLTPEDVVQLVCQAESEELAVKVVNIYTQQQIEKSNKE